MCVSMCARFLRRVVCCVPRLGADWASATATVWSGPVAQGRQQLSPGETATVWGMGDALPGGREEVRDAGMQAKRRRRRRKRGGNSD